MGKEQDDILGEIETDPSLAKKLGEFSQEVERKRASFFSQEAVHRLEENLKSGGRRFMEIEKWSKSETSYISGLAVSDREPKGILKSYYTTSSFVLGRERNLETNEAQFSLIALTHNELPGVLIRVLSDQIQKPKTDLHLEMGIHGEFPHLIASYSAKGELQSLGFSTEKTDELRKRLEEDEETQMRAETASKDLVGFLDFAVAKQMAVVEQEGSRKNFCVVAYKRRGKLYFTGIFDDAGGFDWTIYHRPDEEKIRQLPQILLNKEGFKSFRGPAHRGGPLFVFSIRKDRLCVAHTLTKDNSYELIARVPFRLQGKKIRNLLQEPGDGWISIARMLPVAFHLQPLDIFYSHKSLNFNV